MKRYRRIGTELEHIGNQLMKEACCFISVRYEVMKKVCPYKWEDFQWHDLKVPEQPDGNSCGVFTMLFLRDWKGDGNEISAFNKWNWDTLKEAQQLLITNQFRIDICCSLMKHKTNLLKETIQVEANKFCEDLKAKMEKGGQNARGKKRRV